MVIIGIEKLSLELLEFKTNLSDISAMFACPLPTRKEQTGGKQQSWSLLVTPGFVPVTLFAR